MQTQFDLERCTCCKRLWTVVECCCSQRSFMDGVKEQHEQGRCVYCCRCEQSMHENDPLPPEQRAEYPWPDPVYAAQYAHACGYVD